MPVDYNVNRMIEAVKRRAGTPDTQVLYQDVDFVAFLNEAMFGDIVPSIMRVHEEFFLDSETFTIVNNQDTYPIPSNAVGGKLRSVEFVDSTDDSNFTMIPRSDIETIGARHGSLVHGTSFYLNGNNVVLYPKPVASPATLLRMRFYRRPNELVVQSEGAIVNAIDIGSFTLSLSNVPTSWMVDDAVDVVKGRPPFDVVGDGIIITAIVTNNVTFSAGDLDNVSLNDTVALQGFSITPNISMPEAHRLMEQAAMIRVLEGIDDSDGIATAATLYESYLNSFLTTITPRADSAPKKIVATNGLYDGSRHRGLH